MTLCATDTVPNDPSISESARVAELIGKRFFIMQWFIPFSEAHEWALVGERRCCQDYVIMAQSYWRGFNTLEEAMIEKLRTHEGALLIDASSGDMLLHMEELCSATLRSRRAREAEKDAQDAMERLMSERGMVDPTI